MRALSAVLSHSEVRRAARARVALQCAVGSCFHYPVFAGVCVDVPFFECPCPLPAEPIRSLCFALTRCAHALRLGGQSNHPTRRAMPRISTTHAPWVLCVFAAAAVHIVHALPLPEDGSLASLEDIKADATGVSVELKPEREAAVLEDEAASKRLKRKDNDGLSVVQTALLNFLRPMPIVDTITEEDKYGNDGDKFNRVGKSIVGGVEKVSEFVNRVTNIPVESVKKLSRSATEVLNNIGGRLVGLQR